jgi:hypothetical protein
MSTEKLAMKKVIFIGIDPKFIDVKLAASTGWDTDRVKQAGQEQINKLREYGYEVQNCFVDLGETAQNAVSDALSGEKFDCIMIGAGVRMVPQHTVLFEKIINAVHQKAPYSKISFNTNPGDSAEAVLRWVATNPKKII